MITKTELKDGTTRIIFTVQDERPVSVVGDFNDWNPLAHELVKRSNGTRSVALTVPTGTSLCFRYLADGGEFYDDPDADLIEPNGMGGTHCVVTASASQQTPRDFSI